MIGIFNLILHFNSCFIACI